MNISIQSFLLPLLFIFLYGSGFVFTQYGLENSTAMAFLALRFFIAFFILLFIAYILKVSWPKTLKEFFHIAIAGSMTVGIFSIGVFLSLDFGVSASLSALIIALQPILVTFFATRFMGETINSRILIGLFLGFIGVAFVVSSKISLTQTEVLGVLFSVFALLGLSFGNLYQKRFCSNMNLYSGGAIQTLASTILTLPILIYYETPSISWNVDFMIALFYMSICVSIVALSLLYIMINKGEVSKVSSVFYMMPVCAVIVSYLLFGTNIDFTMIIGIVTVLIGILLINKKNKN